MRIGICSPFMPRDLTAYLDQKSVENLFLVKGQAATPVAPLVQSWHRSGHTLSVICLDQFAKGPIHLTGERLSIRVLPKRRFRHSMVDFYSQERKLIREALELEKPEVISAQWSYEHALGALDTGIPTVVTCHDTPLRYAWISKTFFMTYHVLVAAVVFHRARKLIAVSPYTAEHIRKFFRSPNPPEVIPNGLSTEIFQRGKQRFQKPKEEKKNFNICCVGGWGKIKNVKSLLKAFKSIRESRGSTKLFLFGSGLGAGEEAHSWAKTKSLNEGVVFMGKAPRDEILDFLAAEIDLMIHPSLVECHPMVLIESIACGVPVLAGAKSGGVAWTLGEGKHGKLCDVRSPSEIARVALSMMADPQQMRVSAEKSWQEVRQQFGIDTIAARMHTALVSATN